MSYDSGMYCYTESTDEDDPNCGIDFGEVEVVGESYYPGSFARLLGKLGKSEERVIDGLMAVLVREPSNQYDPDAVAVHILDPSMNAHKVGHLSRDDAADYVETIKKLERRTKSKVGCKARVYGRSKEGLFGKSLYSCRVFLPNPDEWLKWKQT